LDFNDGGEKAWGCGAIGMNHPVIPIGVEMTKQLAIVVQV